MAQRRRDWQKLGANQKKRYIAKGRKLGLTEAEIQDHYESGGDLSAYRGHKSIARSGISERQWRKLRAAAKQSDLGNHPGTNASATEILESLIAKGYTVDWILDRLREQRESTAAYRDPSNVVLRAAGVRMAGRQPGNRRYYGRNLRADIEIYYYH